MPFGYSVQVHCRMERRKDRWFCNPKGIVSSSPAAESARLPWVSVRAIFNPNDSAPSPPPGLNPVGVGRHHPLSPEIRERTRMSALQLPRVVVLEQSEMRTVQAGREYRACIRSSGSVWIDFNQ